MRGKYNSYHGLVTPIYNAAGQVKVRLFTNDLYDWSSTAAVQQGYGINSLNQVATAGSTSLAYDLRGGLSSDGVHTYSYDAPHDQLASVQGGGSTVGLSYDAVHRLAQTQGSATTQFVHDGSAISEELSTSGAVLARYVPGPDGSPLLWYNGSGTGDRRWLLKDQQGSVIAVANSSGQSLATNTYDAYGLPGSSNTGRFQYAGYAFVPEIGLYNTGARTYSPTLGRFLQTDPAGYAAGMNDYAYTKGDPVNGADPTGMWTSCSGDCNISWTSGPGGGDGGSNEGGVGDNLGPADATALQGITDSFNDQQANWAEQDRYRYIHLPKADCDCDPSESSDPNMLLATMGSRLSLTQMQVLVAQNNQSSASNQFITAMAFQESGFYPSVLYDPSNPNSPTGLMQVKPSTAAYLGMMTAMAAQMLRRHPLKGARLTRHQTTANSISS